MADNDVLSIHEVTPEQVIIKVNAKDPLTVAQHPYLTADMAFVTLTRGKEHVLTVISEDGNRKTTFYWGTGGFSLIGPNEERLKSAVLSLVNSQAIPIDIQVEDGAMPTTAKVLWNSNLNTWQADLAYDGEHAFTAKCQFVFMRELPKGTPIEAVVDALNERMRTAFDVNSATDEGPIGLCDHVWTIPHRLAVKRESSYLDIRKGMDIKMGGKVYHVLNIEHNMLEAEYPTAKVWDGNEVSYLAVNNITAETAKVLPEKEVAVVFAKTLDEWHDRTMAESYFEMLVQEECNIFKLRRFSQVHSALQRGEHLCTDGDPIPPSILQEFSKRALENQVPGQAGNSQSHAHVKR